MQLDSVGEVIATRTLHREGGGDVLVKLGKPFSNAPGSEFYCPYQIVGIGDEKVRCIGGVDAIQAIELVHRIIGSVLFALQREHKVRLTWEANDGGDLWFLHQNMTTEYRVLSTEY